MTLGGSIIILILFGLWGANDRRKRNNAARIKKAQLYADQLRRQNDVVTYKVELLNPVTTPYVDMVEFVNKINSICTLERYEELAKEMSAPKEIVDLIRAQISYLRNY